MPFSFSSFFFFCFFSLFGFSFRFFRSPCSPSLILFRSFCPFVLSFSVCFLYRLLRFSSCFPAFLDGGLYYSVISSRRYTALRFLRASSMCTPLALCLLSCVLDVDFFFFLLFLPFFDFDLDIVCFILSFSCGYSVSSFSVSAATSLTYMIHMYLDAYVR